MALRTVGIPQRAHILFTQLKITRFLLELSPPLYSTQSYLALPTVVGLYAIAAPWHVRNGRKAKRRDPVGCRQLNSENMMNFLICGCTNCCVFEFWSASWRYVTLKGNQILQFIAVFEMEIVSLWVWKCFRSQFLNSSRDCLTGREKLDLNSAGGFTTLLSG